MSSELRMRDFTEREQSTVDQIYLLLACFDKNEMSKYFCYWRRRNLIKYNGGGKRVNTHRFNKKVRPVAQAGREGTLVRPAASGRGRVPQSGPQPREGREGTLVRPAASGRGRVPQSGPQPREGRVL